MLVELLLLANAVFASPVNRRWTCSSSDKSDCSLAALAEQAGKVYFGTAWQSFYMADSRFGPILESEFDQYTPENEMKWEVIQPQPNVFNWTGSDIVSTSWIITEFRSSMSRKRRHRSYAATTSAGINKRKLRQDKADDRPTYVTNITDATELKSTLQDHINAVLGRYGNDLYAFDVINERKRSEGFGAKSSPQRQWHHQAECVV